MTKIRPAASIGFIVVIALTLTAQVPVTRFFPALDANNSWTGTNSFHGLSATSITDSALTPGSGVCATTGGLLTTSGCSGGSGVIGSGASPSLAKWSSATALQSSNLTDGTSSISYTSNTGGGFSIDPTHLTFSPTGDVTIGLGGNISGGLAGGARVSLVAQNGSSGGSNGGAVVIASGGDFNNTGLGAQVQLAGGTNSHLGGDVIITPGTGTTRSGVVTMTGGSGRYFYPPIFTFATLGTPAIQNGSNGNGTIVYCSDCTLATPASCTNHVNSAAACTCAGSGSGAFAKRINGVWFCN